MKNWKTTAEAILTTGPVVPVIVVKKLEHAVPMAKALVAGGVRVLEVTLRTECAMDAIRAIAKALDLTLDDFSDDTSKSVLSIPGVLPIPNMVKKPRLGSIACGEPILAVENMEGFDDVPENIHCDFTLICKGDSMIGARIHDGDLVYIRQQPDVENNEIAAVIIDEESVTLKRVYRDGDYLVLISENPSYPPILINGEHTARIIGKAVGFTSILK